MRSSSTRPVTHSRLLRCSTRSRSSKGRSSSCISRTSCPRRTASPLEAFIRCQGGDLRSRTLRLHRRPAGGASHAGTIAGQPADRDPCRSAMRSPSKQPRKLKALRYSARATPAGPKQNAAEAGRGVPENHHFCDPRHSPTPRFHVIWRSTGRNGPSTEGHREMGMGQTVDHSRDGRILRPGPARRARPDVVAQAPQP